MPSTRRRMLTRAGGLFLQLVMVFAGVYGAFLLDRYQEQRRAQQAMVQLYDLLISEVSSVTYGLDRQRIRFDSMYVDPFVTTPTSGLPLRPYYQINGDLSSPELQALLESGGLDASQDGLLSAIRQYNRSAKYYMKISDELRRLSTDQIAPALGRADFYDAEGALRAQYGWYPSMLRQLRQSMVLTVAAAEQVQTLLESSRPET